MKKIYSKPEMVTQEFSAEEYCSTCAKLGDKKAICNVNGTVGYALYSWEAPDYELLDDFQVSCGKEFSTIASGEYKAFKGFWRANVGSGNIAGDVLVQPLEKPEEFTIGDSTTVTHKYHASTTNKS